MISQKIKQIARRCRKVCEQFAWSQDSEEYDYHKSKDLNCMCAVASFFFKAVVEKEGMSINCRKVSDFNMGHVFNEIDGIAIDLTATQFGSKRKIHIQQLDKHEEYLDLSKSKICKRVLWHEEQAPYKKVIDKLLTLYYNAK